eukprot:FR735724.1.p3 GENE.FR735724.1~~FR735724.1.p3  ORF type:complete len:151 (-),score=4.46 FR735724.1:343-795(-)
MCHTDLNPWVTRVFVAAVEATPLRQMTYNGTHFCCVTDVISASRASSWFNGIFTAPRKLQIPNSVLDLTSRSTCGLPERRSASYSSTVHAYSPVSVETVGAGEDGQDAPHPAIPRNCLSVTKASEWLMLVIVGESPHIGHWLWRPGSLKR